MIRFLYLIFRKTFRARNYMANTLSAYRILTSPLLILFLFTGQIALFKWLLAVSFFTDAADGFLARRMRTSSIFGAKLDSIGDDLTVAVAVLGIWKLHPWFVVEQATAIGIVLALLAIQISVALIKFGKMTAYHTYLAKGAAVFQAAWLLCFYFLETPSYALFYLCISVTGVQIMEELLITIFLPVYRVDIRGLFWAFKKRE